MSKLIIEELFNGVTLEQTIRIRKNIVVGYIRPWIYKEGNLADGTLRMEIYDGATLLKTVDTVSTVINAGIPSSYAHGYMSLRCDPLALNIGSGEEYHDYTIKLHMVGYTTNASNYIAWVKEWDQLKYPLFNGPVDSSLKMPYGLEIYSFRS